MVAENAGELEVAVHAAAGERPVWASESGILRREPIDAVFGDPERKRGAVCARRCVPVRKGVGEIGAAEKCFCVPSGKRRREWHDGRHPAPRIGRARRRVDAGQRSVWAPGTSSFRGGGDAHHDDRAARRVSHHGNRVSHVHVNDCATETEDADVARVIVAREQPGVFSDSSRHAHVCVPDVAHSEVRRDAGWNTPRDAARTETSGNHSASAE
mmetsp:Transcript_24726/g.62158  ORF Transcript_24726/g.62158 Transcript_24726/m.62158 type:complete len:213 (+) Transcript_24726:3944-4582(+)